MIYGKLIYNDERGRLDILQNNGTIYVGLHCGNCIEIFKNVDWTMTRVELDTDWFLDGEYGPGQIPIGLT